MILAAGSEVFNKLLNGGYQSGILNTIYGPASSGKTTACLLATISCAKLGKKTVFVDTENGFSVERLKQLTQEFQKVLESVTLVTVKSFKEQT
ncbi:DNA repair protein RadB, partial [Candidatus Woesearchaeota archaeon]|nr:DNA repair protein RadB [Candidatus Woesearchaeota archaeon]